MDRRTVRAGDAAIPAIGLGTWQLKGSICADRVADALSIGYTHVDTARMYGNHEAVGEGMRRSGVDRDRIFLTTKLWLDELRRKDVIARTEKSLQELKTDHLDLLLIHWPSDEVPLRETLEAMLEMRDRGRVRHIGVSNFPPSHLEEAVRIAPIVCDEVEYHPLLSQDRLLVALRTRDLGLIAYSPLAHGDAPGDETLRAIAADHGKSAAQVALRWLIQQDGVVAIPKASSRTHLEENFAVFDFVLDEEEMRRIRSLALEEGRRTADPDFAPVWERRG